MYIDSMYKIIKTFLLVSPHFVFSETTSYISLNSLYLCCTMHCCSTPGFPDPESFVQWHTITLAWVNSLQVVKAIVCSTQNVYLINVRLFRKIQLRSGYCFEKVEALFLRLFSSPKGGIFLELIYCANKVLYNEGFKLHS